MGDWGKDFTNGVESLLLRFGWKIIKFLYSSGIFIVFIGMPIVENIVEKHGFVWGEIVSWLFIAVWIAWIVWRIRRRTRPRRQAAQRMRAVKNPPVPKELKTLEPCGMIFGERNISYVCKAENLDGHVMVIGGAGSGKSSCIAIPTLRAWRERVFAIDIKGELYEKTKAQRTNIKVLNPLDPNAFGYDPYFALKNSDNKPQQARAIALAIAPAGDDIGDKFWIESTQNILTAAILHCSAEEMSFIETLHFIQSMPFRDLIDFLYNSDVEYVRSFVLGYVGLSEKTLSGIMSELNNRITAFATDKNLISCFSREKSITPADLENGYDVYIQIPEHLLEQWKEFLALMIQQFLTHFEQRDENTAMPILFMLDEFPRLGKVQKILNGLATLRSKGITICLIIQSLAQLDSIYGVDKRKVIADNCAYKAILNATDADTQEYFSRLVGTYDMDKITHGKTADPITGVAHSTSENTNTELRRIIKPEEFATLKDIVMLSPHGYFRCDKAPYYEK
jgi:type IV secretion system protein VirD4